MKTNYLYKLMCILALSAGCNTQEGRVEVKSTQLPQESDIVHINKAEFDEKGGQLIHPELKYFPEFSQVSGKLDVPPSNKASVSALVAGYVTQTNYLVGDSVSRGQVLARIESADFITWQQEFLELHHQLQALKGEFNRQELLLQENITSKKKFQDSKSAYLAAESRYAGLKAKLEFLGVSVNQVIQGTIHKALTIKAPISGVITQVGVNLGKYVTAEEPLFEVVNLDHLHLELEVFESDAALIRKGQRVQYKLPQVSDKFYTGTVYLTDAAVGSDKRVSQVHVHLDEEPHGRLLLGMFAEARISRDSIQVMSLPETSVFRDGNVQYVYHLVRGNDSVYSFRKERVRAGAVYGGFVPLQESGTWSGDDRFLKSALEDRP